MLPFSIEGTKVIIPDAGIIVDCGREPTVDDIINITTQAELELDEKIFREDIYNKLTRTKELFLDYYRKMCESLVNAVKENPDVTQDQIQHPDVRPEFIYMMITSLYTLVYQLEIIPEPTFDALKTFIKDLEPEYLLLLVGIDEFVV